MILVCFQGKQFNITVIQVYAPTSNAEEAEQFYEDLQDLLELTPQKNVLFIIGDWNAKVGSQETPGVTGRFGLGIWNEAGQRLQNFAKRMYWSQQTPSSNNTREDSAHGHHQMVNTEIRLIIFFAVEDVETIQSAKTRLGADCGSDHELLTTKFRLKLEKVGKTTRPFRYDLNKIPYDYTVEMTNRFKGFNLIECLKNYGQRLVTLYRRQ